MALRTCEGEDVLLTSIIQQESNARINRARIQRHYGQVLHIKAMLFALRFNELLGAALEIIYY